MVLTDKKEIEEYLDWYGWNLQHLDMLSALEDFSEMHGFGIEEIWCVFASDCKEWEEDYFGETGVQFYFVPPAVDDEITFILSYQEFYAFLADECDRYTVKHPDKAEAVKDYLCKIRANFNMQ